MNETNFPTILISVDKAGHLNQCLAFCDMMGWPVTERILIPGASVMAPFWRRLRASLMAQLCTTSHTPRRRRWSRVRIVASGSASEDLVTRYRRLYNIDLFAVFVGSPKSRELIFDLAIASNHAVKSKEYRSKALYASAAKVLWIPGVFTRTVSIAKAQQRDDLVVALVGGLNKAFRIEPDKIADQLSSIITRGYPLVVVFSRRTALKVERRLREALKAPNAIFIDRSDRVGFEDAFARAREFYVTPDSITMICEACSSKKPVTIFDLECFNHDTSTARFVTEFVEARRVRSTGSAVIETIVPLPSLEPIKKEVGLCYEAWAEG